MQLKVPLPPNATIDGAIGRAAAVQGLGSAVGEAGGLPLGRRHGADADAAEVGPAPCGRPRRAGSSPPGLCQGKGVIDVAAGELIDAVADRRPSLPPLRWDMRFAGLPAHAMPLFSLCVAILGPRI